MGAGASQERDAGELPSSTGFEPLLADDEILPNRGGIPGSETFNVPTSEKPSYASIAAHVLQSSAEAESPALTPREMNPFWVPPLEKSSNRHYHLISVPNHRKPKIDWRAPRPFVIYDYILSAVFLTAAIRLIEPSLHQVSLQAVVGAVLFQAGLVTAVMAAYAIFRSCGRRCFRWEDFLTVVALCVSIYLTRSLTHPWTLPTMSKRGTWQLVVGVSLLEAVAIYAISRGLFLLPTKDETIDTLTIEVESLQTSLAVGLAETYFLDRVRNAGAIIKRAQGGPVPVTYRNHVASSVDVGNLTDNMDVPCIFITLPRYMNWRQDSSISRTKENYVRSGRLIPCEIGDSAGLEDPWLSVTGIRQGYVLDVAPSPLQTIIDDIRSDGKFSNDSQRSEQYEKEIHRFGHRLAWLIMRASLERNVKVLEFEHEIMAHLPAACKEVLTQQRHVVPGHNSVLQSRADGATERIDTESGRYQAR